jgi:hypothetical protein
VRNAVTRGRLAWNIVVTVLIFVVIGPLVGMLAMNLFFSLTGGHGVGSAVSGFLFTLAWLPPIAYFAGAPAAAFTGLVVAVCSAFVRGARLYIVAVVIGALASPFFFYAVLPLSRSRFLTRGAGNFLQNYASTIAVLALVGGIAALVCTWLTKRWRNA